MKRPDRMARPATTLFLPQEILLDCPRRTPAGIDQVSASLPPGFAAETARPIFEGRERAARRLSES